MKSSPRRSNVIKKEIGVATSAGTTLAPNLKYTRPTVNLVALHEVESLYSEDLFFDIGILFIGPVLGIVLEHWLNGTLWNDVSLILLGIFCMLFLAYHVYRLIRKRVQANGLKQKALNVPYAPPESFTSS